MKISGDSIQEGIPTPDEPKKIKHEPKIVVHTIDGEEIMIPIIDKLQKEIKDMRKELDLDEETEIALNNRIMDLEKEIDKQNKVIDEIIDLLQDNLNFSPLNGLNKEELKQYFIRKAEENDKD